MMSTGDAAFKGGRGSQDCADKLPVQGTDGRMLQGDKAEGAVVQADAETSRPLLEGGCKLGVGQQLLEERPTLPGGLVPESLSMGRQHVLGNAGEQRSQRRRGGRGSGAVGLAQGPEDHLKKMDVAFRQGLLTGLGQVEGVLGSSWLSPYGVVVYQTVSIEDIQVAANRCGGQPHGAAHLFNGGVRHSLQQRCQSKARPFQCRLFRML